MSSKRPFPYYYLVVVLTFGMTLFFGTASCTTQLVEKSKDQSSDGVWTRILGEQVSFPNSIVRVTPSSYGLFKLDPKTLDTLLRKAPPEFSTEAKDNPVVITLPLPNGSYGRFRVEESSIMEPDLAARFPQLKAYKGRGLDDPTAIVRFERSPDGLHAMALSASGAFLIDVVGKQGANLYATYLKSSLPPNPKPFACRATPKHPKPVARKAQRQPRRLRNHPDLTMATSDDSLRIYRMAVGASHRYVAAIHALNDPNDPNSGDQVAEALAAIVRTIDRVNLIYETELGVRFILVNDETKVIFADAANDPYDDNANDEGLLVTNQQTLDAKILPANYDIGHLFIVASGGVAAQGYACQEELKGEGLSGSPEPAGNVFDVQYVSHEIGHQLGASHSFNGTTQGCEYRNKSTAYEPGSGSTIMGYSSASNVCGAETIQSTADPYFHAISLKEINEYITGAQGNSCPRKIASGNSFAPVVNAGPDHNIPQGTPFMLTVAGSNDGDGDPLTFSWEEFELGPPDPPHPQNPSDRNKKRPLFRSFSWGTSGLRTFPALIHILNPPSTYTAESLPVINRTMNFRVTVRDERGRYGFGDVQVRVISRRGSANVGPFAVTQPQAGDVWPQGSTQTVVWSAANTKLIPISCQRVRISLLINGDDANPILLAADVPNSGTARISLPGNVPLTTVARIKVEAIDNIFFAISPGDIKIVP
jgi:hypothetical protein